MEELQRADIFETEMDRQTRENMIRFARFMARMIEKYGKEVLEELAAEENSGSLQAGEGIAD
ncbi:MAG: hypothetical protein LUF78_10465 [Clostridiales bacterium]|nr:hypothetical protein [Clostridiales bacterium]